MAKKNRFMAGLTAFIISVSMLLCFLPAIAFADDSLEVDIDSYAVDDGHLKVYLNHNQDEGLTLDQENVDVKFGAQAMTTDEIVKFSDTDENVSYKCVVDVSGSMSQERIDLAKEMIKAIAEKKKSGDNMAITALGNDLVQSPYMTDASEIAEKADILKLTHDDTNLYYCIVEELKGMQTSPDVHDKRCLIIFSDGAEDQATGITREEAEKETEESHIPIFTVALLKKGYKTADEESAKILGSFARLSSGGIHFAPDLGDGKIETIPDSILNRINNSVILKESLMDIEVSGKEVVLKTTVTAGNGQTASDSVNIPEGDVKLIDKEIEKIKETIVEEPPVKPVEVSVEPDEKLIFGMPAKTFYIIAGVSGLLILLIIIFIVVYIMKHKDESEVAQGEGFDQDSGATVMGDGVGRTMGFGGYDGSPTIGMAGDGGSPTVGFSEAAPSNTSGLKVILTRLGKGETGTYNVNVGSSFPIGRSASKSKLSFPDDTAMSGHHCTLSSEGKRLFITDNNSTNGTFVNGVPISGKHELEQDDTVLMGSYEYRISWK